MGFVSSSISNWGSCSSRMHGFWEAYMLLTLICKSYAAGIDLFVSFKGERDSDKRMLVIHFFNLESYYTGKKGESLKNRVAYKVAERGQSRMTPWRKKPAPEMGRGIVLLFVLLISPAVYAQTPHIVGDNAGWDNTVNYVTWARGKTFTVGDSLVFNYDSSHNVDEVSEDDYTNCNTANAITSDSNSPTTIALSTPGPRHFICGRSNHCSQGQRLSITVVAAAGTPSPPSGGATPSPPTGGATPAPPSGGTTPTTPTPTTPTPAKPDGGAAAAFGAGKSLMAGLSLLVMGAMLG